MINYEIIIAQAKLAPPNK